MPLQLTRTEEMVEQEVKDGASEKEQHIREHKHPNPLIGCLDPRALNGTETPLGS
jgi:hypothetical protein